MHNHVLQTGIIIVWALELEGPGSGSGLNCECLFILCLCPNCVVTLSMDSAGEPGQVKFSLHERNSFDFSTFP